MVELNELYSALRKDTDKAAGIDVIFALLVQLTWAIVLVLVSQLFFKISEKVLTINGG
jgi:ABC-type uncharacterized transport system permease subunit